MQRGTNHAEQSNDENGRKLTRNKTMRRGTDHAEQNNKGNGQKSVREQNHAHGNKTAEQRNKQTKKTLGSSYKIVPHRKLTKILTSLLAHSVRNIVPRVEQAHRI
jgi:hypothetical protein